MKIEITVKEQEALLEKLHFSCPPVLDEFSKRLLDIRLKREKTFNDEILFDVGDIVIKGGREFPIVAIRKDKNNRIFYVLYEEFYDENDENVDFYVECSINEYRSKKLIRTDKKESLERLKNIKKNIINNYDRDILASKKYLKKI